MGPKMNPTTKQNTNPNTNQVATRASSTSDDTPPPPPVEGFDIRYAFEKLNYKLDSVIAGQMTFEKKINGIIDRVSANVVAIEDTQASIQFEARRILDLERLQKKHDELLTKHDQAMETINALVRTTQIEQNRQERHSRSFNVRFMGIQERKDENCIARIEELLQRKFGIAGHVIENAHRSGMPADNLARQRHIIARFYSRATRVTVMRDARQKLEGSGVRIVDDLTAEDLKEKIRVQPFMNYLYKVNKRPAFRNGRLYAEKRIVPLDEITAFLESEVGKAAAQENKARRA